MPAIEIPTHWVNLLPDLPGEPLPPLNPATKEPAGRMPSRRSSR
jgi:predicted alternative tryptophan synthase beta-subunit